MYISEIEMYEMLREKMDEREAKTLIQYIETRVEHKFEYAKEIFPTKEDFYRLELKVAQGRDEANLKIAEVHTKIAETHIKIAESKNDLIKWLFGLILGSTVAIIGVMLSVFKML